MRIALFYCIIPLAMLQVSLVVCYYRILHYHGGRSLSTIINQINYKPMSRLVNEEIQKWNSHPSSAKSRIQWRCFMSRSSPPLHSISRQVLAVRCGGSLLSQVGNSSVALWIQEVLFSWSGAKAVLYSLLWKETSDKDGYQHHGLMRKKPVLKPWLSELSGRFCKWFRCHYQSVAGLSFAPAKVMGFLLIGVIFRTSFYHRRHNPQRFFMFNSV